MRGLQLFFTRWFAVQMHAVDDRYSGAEMSKFRVIRIRQFVFSFYMSGLMSLMMSGIITLINTGMATGFLSRWGAAWAVAWAAAFPLVIFVAPLAGKMADATVQRFSEAD